MNKATPKRQSKRNRPNYLGSPMPVKATHNSVHTLNSCNPISLQGRTYSLNDPLVAFVIQNHQGDWRYLRVDKDHLSTLTVPVVYHESYAPELFELLSRVSLDNAIPIDERVIPSTARIIRLKLSIEDITASLIGEDAQIKEYVRLAAVSKLSDAESRLLGLDKLKAKQRLLHNPKFHQNDQKLMNVLSDQFGILDADQHMKNLGVS